MVTPSGISAALDRVQKFLIPRAPAVDVCGDTAQRRAGGADRTGGDTCGYLSELTGNGALRLRLAGHPPALERVEVDRRQSGRRCRGIGEGVERDFSERHACSPSLDRGPLLRISEHTSDGEYPLFIISRAPAVPQSNHESASTLRTIGGNLSNTAILSLGGGFTLTWIPLT